MALKDLFRPKWKHSDPEVRLDAVISMTDQGLLAEIAKTDEWYKVREAAVGQISDGQVLTTLARSNDKSVRWAVCENPNFNDQTILAEIAMKDNIEVAVERLTSQSDLAKIAWSGPSEVGRAATERLTDPALLAEIAYSTGRLGHDWERRKAAVQNPALNDQELFVDLAKNDSQSWVRIAAANRLANTQLAQAVLMEIAQSEKHEEKRKAAVERITDQAVLGDIAERDPSLTVRKAAASQLSDPTAREKLNHAFTLQDEQKRTFEIRNQKIFNSGDKTLSHISARRINDPSFLSMLSSKQRRELLQPISTLDLAYARLTQFTKHLEDMHVYVLILRPGIDTLEIEYAQRVCDCVFTGLENVSKNTPRVSMFKYVDGPRPTVDQARQMCATLDIKWGDPLIDFDGYAHDGVRVAVLCWEMAQFGLEERIKEVWAVRS
jgi:hypothetical protein